MMRRTGVLVVTALLVSGAAVVGIAAAPASAASAPTTPRVGTVACAADGWTKFRPFLGYSPGRGQKPINPDVDSKWKLRMDLTGCTGSQTGGNPKLPDPIAGGDVLIKAVGVDHTCGKATLFGATTTRVRISWADARGRRLKQSVGTGTITVEGLANGTKFTNFPSPQIDPNYVPPGIITLHVTATLDAASAVFPGQTLSMTLVADQTIDDMPFPCSLQLPPATVGVGEFDYTGEHGPSSLSVG